MKSLIFEENSYEEYIQWATQNSKIWERINDLIKDIDRNHFKGIGKPEPLKHHRKGYWSRRITEEHRLIYKIENDKIVIASFYGHYGDK